jgi:microcystin-dependent protein
MPSHTHTILQGAPTGSSVYGSAFFSTDFINASNAGYTSIPPYNGRITGSGMLTECFSSNSITGSSISHNNLQPYITCYFFKRTA